MSYGVIIEKWNELDGLLKELQLKDSSTPGLRREVQIAHLLGHYVHRTKHGPDAYNPQNEAERYEYLCSEVGHCVQMDRIDLTNVETRIGKNAKIFAAFFRDGVVVKIYEIDPKSFLNSAITKIERGEARAKVKGKEWTGKHLGWGEDEITKLNAKVVYSTTR